MKRVMEVLKEARLDEAADLAASGSRPEVASLLKTLYGKGAAEDVVAYTANELVAFAEGAMSSLSLRVPGHGTVGPGHLCFAASAEEIEAWRTRLSQAGVAIEADFQWPGEGRSIYFRDPSGNSIEIADPRIWGIS